MNDFSFRINEGDAADAVTVTVRILRCGEEICRPDKHPAEGLRDYYSLHVVKSGRGHLRRILCRPFHAEKLAVRTVQLEFFAFMGDKICTESAPPH